MNYSEDRLKDHVWVRTGRSYLAQILRNGKTNGHIRRYIVKCKCGAQGFQREGSPVVYTSDENTPFVCPKYET